MEHTFLGIDMGTSAMKLILINEKKEVLAQESCEYPVVQADGGVREVRPEVWFDCMGKGIHSILKGQRAELVRGIGVTGQMHTLVVLDKNGDTLRPAMMWNDTRTKALIPGLREKMRSFTDGDYLSGMVSTGSAAANLYWMKLYEPENLEKLGKFMIGPDYLVYRLTGNAGTDYCEASTSSLYCITQKEWSEEIRALIGLRPEVYPEIRGSAVKAGTLLPELAAQFGFGPDVAVITGTGDNPATAISTGCLGQGYPVLSLGTSGVFMMPIEKPRDGARGKRILMSFDGNSFFYLAQGAVQSNGNTFDWWNLDIMALDRCDAITKQLRTDYIPDERLMFYPHLGGDKTIYSDPDIRGAFVGLSIGTTREDMTCAVIEGLCFAFRELAEEMCIPIHEFGSVKVVGGGAKSAVWMQALADILNTRVEKLDGMTGAAFGIALLSAYQEGYFSSLSQLSDGNIQIEKHFEPIASRADLFNRKYQKYLRMHEALQYINGTKTQVLQ